MSLSCTHVNCRVDWSGPGSGGHQELMPWMATRLGESTSGKLSHQVAMPWLATRLGVSTSGKLSHQVAMPWLATRLGESTSMSITSMSMLRSPEDLLSHCDTSHG